MKATRDLLCLAGLLFALGAPHPVHAEGLYVKQERLAGSFWGVQLGVVDKPRLFLSEPRIQGYTVGVSYAFTPSLSATLDVESSSDLRFTGVPREPQRTTSLGLRYRY
ncbi:hypothetical protein [Caenimonas aquaedulcis]|uniref:Outer membrane protein beta-barrel domain-containing protein n=1 Tax=Caenimonas aquaedulcis TaxID=2793270 RepID=A0A931H425_9BURK|nr:hypothetical protein [Caenimonas aquaedulcis]MBG9388199.1 hypothetical protein [Caenimonas aquaedulcis]